MKIHYRDVEDQESDAEDNERDGEWRKIIFQLHLPKVIAERSLRLR